MNLLIEVLIAVVAGLHIYSILEMFLWQTPKGFMHWNTPEIASQTAVLAKNQDFITVF